jgi:hypothetical protein
VREWKGAQIGRFVDGQDEIRNPAHICQGDQMKMKLLLC